MINTTVTADLDLWMYHDAQSVVFEDDAFPHYSLRRQQTFVGDPI